MRRRRAPCPRRSRMLHHRQRRHHGRSNNMGERAAALADQFEQTLGELIATVEGCSEEQWRAMCGAEGRPLPDLTWDDINGTNERRAGEQASCSKDEVLASLRDGGREMAAYVRGLSDEQLDRTGALPLAGGAQVSTQQLIEGGVLIDHARGHLASIRAAG